ncbi:hypothetical protein GGQ74_001730 [Desulfobaculum xiamenense]|uniref:Uncharacterized protein n=1 Tax=Desulfobaculum xiamenense TaxID=995050 RepID=A0A846QLJ3_9BACT|nr:hypothetical protein [Desulfobaculum xiamenense]NJB68057.1 hypothetical protein [Desulfobaculum xiamenense]
MLNVRDVKDRLNARQRVVVVIMDIMLLLELCLCMYYGSAKAENLTIFFLKVYLPALLVTVITARIFIRRFRTNETVAEAEAA